jgi:hypothetical protein
MRRDPVCSQRILRVCFRPILNGQQATHKQRHQQGTPHRIFCRTIWQGTASKSAPAIKGGHLRSDIAAASLLMILLQPDPKLFNLAFIQPRITSTTPYVFEVTTEFPKSTSALRIDKRFDSSTVIGIETHLILAFEEVLSAFVDDKVPPLVNTDGRYIEPRLVNARGAIACLKVNNHARKYTESTASAPALDLLWQVPQFVPQ